MLWFKVFLTDPEISRKLDKKLLVEFFDLTTKLDFPTGLAAHSSTIDLEADYFYLFSTPNEYVSQLTTIFHKLRYEEILEPDLTSLSTILGNYSD